MMDPTLVSALCRGIEASINTALRYDPASQQALAALSGRVLAVELAELNLRLYVLPEIDGLRIQSYCEQAVETSLRGTTPALLALVKSDRLNLKDSGVEVSGNTGLLLSLQRILSNLDLDWEEALSQLLGDVLAHQGAEALRGFGKWLSGRRENLEQRLGEYLSEELRTTPSRAELDAFAMEVDELRLANDRLAARIDFLIRASNENNKH